MHTYIHSIHTYINTYICMILRSRHKGGRDATSKQVTCCMFTVEICSKSYFKWVRNWTYINMQGHNDTPTAWSSVSKGIVLPRPDWIETNVEESNDRQDRSPLLFWSKLARSLTAPKHGQSLDKPRFLFVPQPSHSFYTTSFTSSTTMSERCNEHSQPQHTY